MEIITSREDIIKTLGVVAQTLSQKPSLPVLNNFLMESKAGFLETSATNLDTTISKKLPVKVVSEGRVTVPARLLMGFCQTAGGDQVRLEVSDETAQIQIGKANATLTTIPENEFPPTALFDAGEKITMDHKTFTNAAAEVGVCAAPEEGRPVLTGVLFRKSGDGLNIVATDGYRLGKKKIKTEGAFDAVIPARALLESVKALAEEEEETVELAVNKEKNQARVKTRNLTVLSRLLEGEYPNYEQIIPTSFSTQAEMKTKELVEAIRLASVLARDLGNVVRIEVGKTNARINANTNQVGEAETTIPAKVSGDKIEIAFNSKFLLDSLSVIKDGDTKVSFSGATSAVVIQGTKSKDLTYVVMPVRSQT